MSGFLFALIACVLASLGARDQALVAALRGAQGPRPALLLVALATAAACTALAAWAGAKLLADLAPHQRGLVAALGLLAAGGEMLLLRAPRTPAEPTRSLFAAGVVLLAHQLTDAARLLVLALATATAAPVTAGLGGLVGSGAALAAGWIAPGLPPRLLAPRRWAGAVLAALGAVLLGRRLIA